MAEASSGVFDHARSPYTAVCRCFIPTCAIATLFWYFALYICDPAIAIPDPQMHMTKRTRPTRRNGRVLRFLLRYVPCAPPSAGTWRLLRRSTPDSPGEGA